MYVPSAGFMILNYIFETYLNIRQHRALKLPTLPKSLAGVISDEKFEKARAYSLDKRCLKYFIEFSQSHLVYKPFLTPNFVSCIPM
jgi:hypothetical protein